MKYQFQFNATFSRFVIVALSLLLIATSSAQDSDGDGVPDTTDNCLLTPNASQFDVDGDLFGNLCDGDFNNDGATNFIDFSQLAAAFLTANPVVDLDGNGIVNFVDVSIFVPLFNAPPGPGPTGAGFAVSVQPVYMAKCAPCHTGLTVGGHDIGTTYSDSFLTAGHSTCSGLNVGQCSLVRIQNGQMPNGAGCTGNPITDAGNPLCLTYGEQILVFSWVNGGLLP